MKRMCPHCKQVKRFTGITCNDCRAVSLKARLQERARLSALIPRERHEPDAAEIAMGMEQRRAG